MVFIYSTPLSKNEVYSALDLLVRWISRVEIAAATLASISDGRIRSRISVGLRGEQLGVVAFEIVAFVVAERDLEGRIADIVGVEPLRDQFVPPLPVGVVVGELVTFSSAEIVSVLLS